MQRFSLEPYLGKWYDVAHYPTLVWQKGCAGSVAEYALVSKGVISVKNTCLDAQGKVIYSRQGEARVANPLMPSKLRIGFRDGLPADPEGWYWVLWTDYQNYAIVSGGPQSDYLWLLSRTPRLPLADVSGLLQRVDQLGYDSKRLVTSPHTVLP